MLIESRAVVLGTLKYNDENLIATLLTERAGCVSFIVRVSKSRRARVRHTLFQPLQPLYIIWNARANEGLVRPQSAEAVPLRSVPYDPAKSAVALFLAEFMHHALRKEPASGRLFDYVWRSLEWFDLCEHDFANFHLVFLLRFSRLLGYFPNMEEWREGLWFDLQTSEFTGVRPSHDHAVSPEDAALLPKLLRLQYGTMRVFRLNGAQRSRLLQSVCDYYRLHVAEFPELRSLGVLREVFA